MEQLRRSMGRRLQTGSMRKGQKGDSLIEEDCLEYFITTYEHI